MGQTRINYFFHAAGLVEVVPASVLVRRA